MHTATPGARKPSLLAISLTFVAILMLVLTGGARANGKNDRSRDKTVRFASFNASLNRFSAGGLVTSLSTPDDVQAQAVAEIIQRTNPDLLLVNEFDYDDAQEAARLFRENYVEVDQDPTDPDVQPVYYPYFYVAPSNTGIPSGFDFDNNGSVGGGNDAFGFGFFPGQFGMAVYSKYPILRRGVRTFQTFRWKDMPGARLPDDPATPEPADWYSADELEVFRLSSKSHWDLPVLIGRRIVYVLASHPTPPVFDGPEDRNGTRNFDEIRFWADYVSGWKKSRYIYDDKGRRFGLWRGASFVIMGDQNSDPNDGDSIPGAIQQLLDHPRVNAARTPDSEGAVEAALLQGGANDAHVSSPAFDTADFGDGAPGNLRVDYVLPSRNLEIRDSGVFWPTLDDPLSALTGTFPFPSSDHRLVYVDVELPGRFKR